MDDLLRDPELAPHVVKLLNDKLQEARKALQASKKVSSLINMLHQSTVCLILSLQEAETSRTEIQRLQECKAREENRENVEKDRLKVLSVCRNLISD